MRYTEVQQIEQLRNRIIQYEQQVAELERDRPITNMKARLILSLQAQLSIDKESYRLMAGKPIERRQREGT